jgi:hypothetical protein
MQPLSLISLLFLTFLIGFHTQAMETEALSTIANDCDFLFCAGNNNQRAESETGVAVAPVQSAPVQLSPPPARLVPSGEIIGGTVGAPSSERPDVPPVEGATTEAPSAQEPGGQAQNQPQNQPTNPGGMQGSSFAAPAGSGPGTSLQGGYLYSDDSANSEAPPPNSPTESGVVTNGIYHNTSTGQGEGSDRSAGQDGSKNKGEGPLGGAMAPMAGASTSGGLGGLQPGTGSDPLAQGNGRSPSLLDKIARGLGLDSFWGSSGGANSRGKAGASAGGHPTSGPKAASGGNGAPNSRQALQAQFDRFRQQRGTASQMEFGSANSLLFKGMCQHYNRYAYRNHLPQNQANCPEN